MSLLKSVQHAYERNNTAIAWWLKQEYPANTRQAKLDKTAIYWDDASDYATDTSNARTR